MWKVLKKLWNFVKKKKVGEFDFKQANRLVSNVVREHALDYFNGLTEKDKLEVYK